MLCGSRPVKIDARLGQHSESLVMKRVKLVPSRARRCTLGMNRSRSVDRSSVSTKTMFGCAAS